MVLTRYDFLFPYTHLVVDKTVLLHGVAILDELGAHLLKKLIVDQRFWRLWSLARCGHFLRHGLLLLQCSEPAGVEFFPQLQTLLVVGFVVAY